MPRDDWAKARAKDAARRAGYGTLLRRDREHRRNAKKAIRLTSLVTLDHGTDVLVRKHGELAWTSHSIRVPVTSSITRSYGDTLYLRFKNWEISYTKDPGPRDPRYQRY